MIQQYINPLNPIQRALLTDGDRVGLSAKGYRENGAMVDQLQCYEVVLVVVTAVVKEQPRFLPSGEASMTEERCKNTLGGNITGR